MEVEKYPEVEPVVVGDTWNTKDSDIVDFSNVTTVTEVVSVRILGVVRRVIRTCTDDIFPLVSFRSDVSNVM